MTSALLASIGMNALMIVSVKWDLLPHAELSWTSGYNAMATSMNILLFLLMT